MQYQSLNQIGDLLSQAEGNFWCKNETGEYFGVGQAFVKYSGLSSRDQIVGKTDYQLPWSDGADSLERHDKETIAKNYIYVNTECVRTVDKKLMTFLVAKFPIYNCKSHLLGTVGCAELLPEQFNVINSTTVISEQIVDLCQDLFATLKQQPKQIHTDSQNKHSLVIKNQRIFFTERELHCLGFLVLGKGAKETGLLLNISAKTVEYYLQRVKDKLKCYHRSQLITVLFDNQVVPQLIQMIDALKTR